MSGINSLGNYSFISSMVSDLIKNYDLGAIRDMIKRYNADDSIAIIMAAVSNKVGVIMHDVDDPDNDEETNSRIIAECEAWWALYKELCTEIIRRLEEENLTKGTDYVTSGIGLHYIVKPFMERNGYLDGSGWWIKI